MTTARREGANGLRRGAEHDEDDDRTGDDEQLRAMRAVWLSMREEEPSGGGLAELMAAARGQAAQMAPPTLWHRLVVGFRRPPVLAFATVLVLLGGALVVGRHAEERAPTVVVSTPGEATRAGGVAPVQQASTERPRPRHEAAAEPPGAAAPAIHETTARGFDVGGARPPTQIAHDKRGTISTTSGDRAEPPATLATPRPPVEVPKSPAPEPGMNRADEDNVMAPADPTPGMAGGTGRAAPADQVGEASPPTRPTISGATATTSEGLDHKREHEEHKDVARSGPTPAALYRACEAAAVRGDCAEVRRLVTQISKTDRGYRGRIAKATQISACLAQ